jgi:filamentous hemagglutinin
MALDNQGSLYTGQAFNIAADTFTLGAAASLSSAQDITIDVTGALDNAGKIVAKSVDLRGGSVSSTGTLGTQQGDLHLEARQGDLTLGGIVSSAAGVDATASGAIRQSGQLGATDLALNAAGDIVTQGDITAHTATLTSGATLNQAGTLSADTVSLSGAAVKNDGRTLSSGDLNVHGGSVDVAGVLACWRQASRPTAHSIPSATCTCSPITRSPPMAAFSPAVRWTRGRMHSTFPPARNAPVATPP